MVGVKVGSEFEALLGMTSQLDVRQTKRPLFYVARYRDEIIASADNEISTDAVTFRSGN